MLNTVGPVRVDIPTPSTSLTRSVVCGGSPRSLDRISLMGKKRLAPPFTAPRPMTPSTAHQPPPSAFHWTLLRGSGPGSEIFGSVLDRQVVELGCGLGDNLLVLANQGAFCIGIDVNPVVIAQAQRRRLHPRIRYAVADVSRRIDDLALHNSDIAYSVFGAISYAPPLRVMRTARSLLRRSGRLVFSARHSDWDEALARTGAGPGAIRIVGNCWKIAGPSGRAMHVFKHSASEYLCMARANGFQTIMVTEVKANSSQIRSQLCVSRNVAAQLSAVPHSTIIALQLD